MIVNSHFLRPAQVYFIGLPKNGNEFIFYVINQ